jgi:hypothetical protein
MSSPCATADFAPGYGALPVTAGDRIPCRAWLAHGLGRAYRRRSAGISARRVAEGFTPTSALIMPLLNMFRSRQGRSTSLPRSPEGYWHDAAAYDSYGQRSKSGFSHAAHRAPHQAGTRAPRYPSYGSSFRSSGGAERYAESSTSDDQVRSEPFAASVRRDLISPKYTHKCMRNGTQSWYRVEHPDHYQRGPRDHDAAYYPYSEDGTDRRSDASGPLGDGDGPFPSFSNSDSSRVESPIPTVYREGPPGLGSRLFEEFAGQHPRSHPRAPASVTRLDLHEEEDAGPQGHYQSFAPDPRRRHDPPYRRPSQHAYQVCIWTSPPSRFFPRHCRFVCEL